MLTPLISLNARFAHLCVHLETIKSCIYESPYSTLAETVLFTPFGMTVMSLFATPTTSYSTLTYIASHRYKYMTLLAYFFLVSLSLASMHVYSVLVFGVFGGFITPAFSFILS